MTPNPTPAAASEPKDPQQQPPDVSRHCPECERLAKEVERLRQFASRQTEEIEALHDMADAVERLREIGRATGCDHVDSSDGRTQLVNCVEQVIAKAEIDRDEARQQRDEARAELEAMQRGVAPPTTKQFRKMAAAQRAEQDELDQYSPDYWACFTGDCPHDNVGDCLTSVQAQVAELFTILKRRAESAEQSSAKLRAEIESEVEARVLANMHALEKQREEAAKKIAKIEQEAATAKAERDQALRFIMDEGYRRCDIPACNCGSWHDGHAGRRLREISDALAEAGCEPLRKTALVAVCELAAERDALLAGAAPPVEATPSGEEVIVVDEKRCVFERTKDFGACEPQGWYIRDEAWEYELRRDGKWWRGFDSRGVVSPPWPTEQSARDFARQVASKGEVGRGRKTPQLHIVRRRHRKAEQKAAAASEARERVSLLQQATSARWIIAVHLQVDGQFQAFARKPGQRADEVLPQIDVNEDWQGNVSLERTSIGRPGQCATAATPEAAIDLLCERLLGISP